MIPNLAQHWQHLRQISFNAIPALGEFICDCDGRTTCRRLDAALAMMTTAVLTKAGVSLAGSDRGGRCWFGLAVGMINGLGPDQAQAAASVHSMTLRHAQTSRAG